MAELVYYGRWFTPLKQGIMAFVDESQKYVSGTVKVKFEYKSFKVVGRKSEFSLYDLELATYDRKDKFDPKHSESFIKLYGYPYEILGRKGRIDG
jgi:argininosuccinate synthase